MLSPLLLRRYRRDDLEAIFALDTVCFAAPFRFSRTAMRHFAEARGAHTIIADRAPVGSSPPTLAGFVIVQIERDLRGRRGYIVTLDVSPTERRTGVGSQLMKEAEALATEARALTMHLHVFAGNPGAIRFYEARDYVRIGEQPGFYGAQTGTSLDALIYRKELPTSP